MTIEIVIPQVGEAVSEVTLIAWLKKEGDQVKKGDVLFEVDTDKAVVEVESFAAGVLAQILVPASSAVMPQQVVGLLAEAGEAPQAPPPVAATPPPKEVPVRASPSARRAATALEVDLAQVKGSGPGGRIIVEDVKAFATQPTPAVQTIAPASNGRPPRVLASPKARRVAQELGVELAGLAGTGVDGLITAKDVEAAAAIDAGAPQPSAAEVQPLSKLRQTIARRMQASKQIAPHFYLTAETDMTQAQQLRAYCRQTLGWERSPTYTDLIVRACVVALVAMPDCNITYTDAGLAPRPTIDIGVAVSVADGLIVPVLPGADRLSLAETSAQIRDLGERARQGRLRPADMGAKSMVVSNLGMTGVDSFTAIIDPPDPMILAVGRVAERIVPLNGQPVIRPMCTLTLSADHRAFDGVQGAQFLMRVKAILENPFEIMAGR